MIKAAAHVIQADSSKINKSSFTRLGAGRHPDLHHRRRDLDADASAFEKRGVKVLVAR